MLDVIEKIFESFVSYCIIGVEFIGVCALVLAVVRGIIGFIRHDSELRLKLAEGIALALEFKIGSEILRTVIVRSIGEIAILGSVILLRGALAFLVQWEIRNERERQ